MGATRDCLQADSLNSCLYGQYLFALKLVAFAMFIEIVHLKCVKGVYWSVLVQAIGVGVRSR
jgi:hypothetical protein